MIIPTPNLWSWTIYRRPRNDLDWLFPNVSSLTYRDSNGTRDAVSMLSARVAQAFGIARFHPP